MPGCTNVLQLSYAKGEQVPEPPTRSLVPEIPTRNRVPEPRNPNPKVGTRTPKPQPKTGYPEPEILTRNWNALQLSYAKGEQVPETLTRNRVPET